MLLLASCGDDGSAEACDDAVRVELLSPSTRYELIHEGAKEQRVISTFKTAQARDDAPPRWRGPTQLS